MQEDPKRMRKFIDQRRKMMKAMEQSQPISDNLTKLITQNDGAGLLKQFNSQSVEFVYTYLLSQDQLLKTPIELAIEQPKWDELLASINQWSNVHLEQIRKKLNPAEQQPNPSDPLKPVFESIIRAVCKKPDLKEELVVQVFSRKDTLLAELMKLFLTYENIVALMPENRQLKLFQQVFSIIATSLELKSAEDIKKFSTFKRREKTWKESKFVDMLSSNPQILTLKEMNYNFMHELALKKDEKLIYQILDKLEEDQDRQVQQVNQVKQGFFCTFDSGRETPLDIILSKWSFEMITKLLTRAKSIECIYLSVNCLNKVICNKQLNERQVEALVGELLDGEVAARGYSQQVIKEKSLKIRKFQGLIRRESSDYVVVLDRRRVLMAKDKRQSYPLLNYLDRFMERSSLKVIMKLFFQFLDRQTIKTKVISALRTIGIDCKQFSTQNQALKQIEQVIYYHQSLLKLICHLPHNEILQFFIDKLFINYFTISIWSKTNGSPVVHMINRHFVTNYIEVHKNLTETQLNKKIVSKIFDVKENQKYVLGFNLYLELLRQFNQSKIMNQSKEWLALQIKARLKAYFTDLEKNKFIFLASAFNEGQKPRRVFLVDLLDPIFTSQEIKAMDLPAKPFQQQIKEVESKKKKIQEHHIQIKKEYKNNRSWENFQVELAKKLQQKVENIKEIESHRSKMEEKYKSNIEQQEANEPRPQVVILQWHLQLDQPELQQKIKKLIEKGFKIKFKTNRQSILGQNQRQNNALKTISQPLRTIAQNVLKSPHKVNNKQSLGLHVGCFICLDEQVDRIFKYLQSAPKPFLQTIATSWKQIVAIKIELNPLLLLKLIKSPTLSVSLMMKEQETKNHLIDNIRQGIRNIVAKISMKPEENNYVPRILVYRELVLLLGKDIYKDNMSMFGDYIKLHSEKVNLSGFCKEIPSSEVFENYTLHYYLPILLAMPNPYKVMVDVFELLKPVKLDVKRLRQRKMQQQQLSQELSFSDLGQKERHLQLDFMSKFHFYSPNQFMQMAQILDKLTMADFNNLIAMSPPACHSLLMALIQKMKDEQKCLKLLDLLIQASTGQKPVNTMQEDAKIRDNAKLLQNCIKTSIIRLIRSKFDKLNSAICSFVLKNHRTFVRFTNEPTKKSTINYNQFLIESSEANFQIYLNYLGKMIKLTYIPLKEKQQVLFYVFTLFFHAEEWQKSLLLLEKLRSMRSQIKNVTEDVVEPKESPTENPVYQKFEVIQEFVMHCLDLIAKNKSRQATYKQKDAYQKMIKTLFKLTEEESPNENQKVFQSAWTINPQQAVKIVKLSHIDLLRLARCVNVHPSNFKLLQNIPINQSTMPITYKHNQEGKFLPLSQYSVHNYQKSPYLVDLMIFQQKIRDKWVQKAGQDIKKYEIAFDQKKKCVFLVKEVMKRYKQVYNEEELKKYCGQIFSSNTLQSLKNIPKAYLQTYFANHKEIRGICNLKESMVKQIIQMGHVNQDHLLQIIKSSRMDLVDYFLEKTKAKIDFQAIQEIEEKHLNKNSSFIMALLYLQNQKFCIDFVKKFKILNLYPMDKIQIMIKDALWGIALLQRTAFLKIFLEYLTEVNKGPLKYAEAPAAQQQPEKTQQKNQIQQPTHLSKEAEDSGLHNSTLFLPIRIAISTNFYEYLLLLEQSRVKPKNAFKTSNRFLFELNPEQFNFIPLMKKKLQLLKIVYDFNKGMDTKQKTNQKYLEQAFNGIMLSTTVDSKDNVCYFLKYVLEGELDMDKVIEEIPGDFKNIYMMIAVLKTLPDAQIPDDILTKQHPQQTKLVNHLLKETKFKVKGHQHIHKMIQNYQLLRDLLYIANPKYMEECALQQPMQNWAILFSHAFSLQVRYFQQPENAQFMEKFIHECYFAKQREQFRNMIDEATPFDYRYNEQKIKDILVCCLTSKYEGNGRAIEAFCHEAQKMQDQIIMDLAVSLCIFKKFNAGNPLSQINIRHNFGLWNSIAQNLEKANKIKKLEKNNTFKPFFVEKYEKMIKFEQNKPALAKCSQGLLSVYGALSFLSNILNIIGEQRETQEIINDIEGKNDKRKVRIILGTEYKTQKINTGQEIIEVLVYTPFQIVDVLPMRIIRLDPIEMRTVIQKNMYWQKLSQNQQLIQPCECLSKMNFDVNVDSIKRITSLPMLKEVMGANNESGSLTTRVKEYVKELADFCQEQKDGKVFSLSDVYGPVAINDETDKSKVLQCLNFYELSKLPDSKITIKYEQNPVEKTSQFLLSDIREYIRYFTYEINDDQSQNKTPYVFNTIITITPKKNNPDTFTLLYPQFFINNIVNFINRINKYGRDISATFNHQVLFKYSTVSIMKIIQQFDKDLGTAEQVYEFLSQFLNCRRHVHFIEEILLMVSEDANNIMKAVKGILLIFQFNKDNNTKKDQKPYKINEKLSYFDIDYKIDDQMFKIYIKAGLTKKDTPQLSPIDSNLISRKDFLSTVFSSTQFLTGYFMNKSALANQLVKNSKQISRTVNSMVNISVNYKQLQNFVDKIKEKITIKEIDGFLTNLNTYISSNYVKFINTHLISRQLAIQHQVSLIKCFEKLNSGNEQVKNQIRLKVQGDELGKGIHQIYNFTSELKSGNNKESNIKNMYLIQIYKSYFASVVSEGMSFILGFKTNKPTLIIQLQKKQDIDKVNIAELSFLLLISNRVPTNDEINHSKIIKIFVTDLNENVYEINRKVKDKLLGLPEESDDRTLANMVPVIESNIILGFVSEFTKDQSDLKDDASHRHFELSLNKQSKFKIKIKNQSMISCIDLLKIDVMFNNAAENLSRLIKTYITTNFTIRIKTPNRFQAPKASQILNMAFLDADQMFSNLFFEPPRNRELELFASAQLGEDIRQNLILRERRKLFEELYDEIVFQICQEGDSKMKIENKSIKIMLAPKVSHSLSSSLMSDTLIKDQIEKLMAKSEKVKKIYQYEIKMEELSDILDHLIIGRYQIQAMERALENLKRASLSKLAFNGFKVILKGQQKTTLLCQKDILTMKIRLKNTKREFYSTAQIMQLMINNFTQIIEGLVETKYNHQAKCIEFYNYDIGKPATLILLSKDKIQVKEINLHSEDGSSKKSTFPIDPTGFAQYYVIQKQNQFSNLVGNWFWSPDPTAKYISQPQSFVLTKHKQTLLLKCPVPIIMNECNVNAVVHLIKSQKANDIVNITKKTAEFEAQVQLLSKEVMKLEIIPYFSSTITLHLGKFRLVDNEGLQNLKIKSTSGQAMVEEKTKFVQLLFRNKVFRPNLSQSDKNEQNITFNEPAQKVTLNQMVQKKEKNVEQMVYIVNEHARKFLTRAGEPRTDVINVCDEEGNAISFNPATKIYFRHLNIESEIIVPEIKCEDNNTRIQLKWTPIVRGPYEVFLNNTRLNPNYEIGVCAAVIDVKSCKVETPKKTDLCFMEETECSLVLKDSYGNIYTQLEEAIINDELIIQITSEDVNNSIIKTKAQKIDKYGLKKIRFSIDDPTGSEATDVKACLLVNMEKIVEFNLKIKGQSLGQRRKNLQKQIESCTKRYYTDVTISRANFMESLFKIAQKSLDKNFSIRFAGEQGIDAGGLKREFYDMIGKQMKDPQNPFFIQTDMTRHNQYFINPEIMKNKKKSEYMTLFGKFLANSLINSYLIGINFSPTFVKLLYQDPITFEDMLAVLPKQQADRYQFLRTADADYIDDLEIYFSCILNRKKGIEVEMIENGKNIKVTKDNVKQYLQLLPEFLIVKRYDEIIDSFRSGFQSVLDLKVVRKWIRTDQFWCMTAGVKEITAEIVLNYVVIRGGKETHHAWFRTYITEASQEILEGFLKFSSGSSSIDFYQTSKITVQFEIQGENPKKLPISHTCWKQIQIPAYKSFAIMKQLLNAAFLYCSEGFGFG